MDAYIINQQLNKVEAHSNFRIPFEPKGIQLAMRNELRKKINCLTANDNKILKATFCSSDDDFYDVENVLIYNIGFSSFRNSTTNGFIIRKDHKATNNPNNLINTYSYELIDKTNLEVDNPLKLISFTYTLNNLNTQTKVYEHFLAFKNSKFKTYSNTLGVNQNLGIHIKIESNKKIANPINLVKPLIDGIVSGLHYDMNLSEDTKIRLVELFNIPLAKINDLFSDSSLTILGTRKVVSAYRNGVKWNPEDERCVDIRVEPVTNMHINNIKISGYIFAIT